MTSIFGVLNTARQGIITQQSALSVTSDNIANVNTPGYTRQRADIQQLVSGGVKLAGIQRLNDEFTATRLHETNARLGASDTLSTNLAQMESLMGETDTSGLTTSLRNFFSALHDLTLQPSGTTERESLSSQTQQLNTSLASMSDQFQQVGKQIDLQVVDSVGRINTITSEIATLNQRIQVSGVQENNDQHPEVNQILDKRDQLVNELSSIIPVHTTQDAQGVMTVFGNGEVLVDGVNQHKLSTIVDQGNSGYHQVVLQDATGNYRPMRNDLQEGSLGGLLEARDGYAKQSLDQLDRMAAQLIQTVNNQHKAGTGLDGVSGRDFFSGLSVTSASDWQNKGGATVASSSITSPATVSFDDYEIRFTSANQFDVVDTTSGAALSSNNAYVPGANVNFAGMRVVLNNGASGPVGGDVFRVNAYSGTAGRIDLSAPVKADLRAIAAGTSAAPGDNSNALRLAGLQDVKTMSNPPSQTFEAYYDSVRLQLSMGAQSAQTAKSDDQISQQQVQNLSDSISGVSLDEEATQVIQYQRAFQASGRVISVTDELLQTLLQMF